jgi:hypothetical protein
MCITGIEKMGFDERQELYKKVLEKAKQEKKRKGGNPS